MKARHIGKLAFFLLNLGVYPLYTAPRSPWNNGQVEGFNSVFSKKFWMDDFKNVNLKSKLLKINIELDDGSLKEVKSMAFVIKNVIYSRA